MIRTYTDADRLQLDGDMMTWGLRRSGTARVVAQAIGSSARSLSVPASRSATVALAGGQGYVAAYAGGTSAARSFVTNAPVGTEFQFYVFEEADRLALDPFGLLTRDPKGDLTFSSNQYPMRPLATIGAGQQYESGRALAFAQGTWAGHRIPGARVEYSGNRYGWSVDGKAYGGVMQGGRVTTGQCSFADAQVGPSALYDQPSPVTHPLALTVLDVTGFPLAATFAAAVDSPLKATRRQSGTAFWLGL